MSALEGIGIGCLLVWLLGVGLLAHAIPVWLRDDEEMPDYVRAGIAFFPERVAVLLAFVIVGWPLAVPALILMQKAKEKEKG